MKSGGRLPLLVDGGKRVVATPLLVPGEVRAGST